MILCTAKNEMLKTNDLAAVSTIVEARTERRGNQLFERGHDHVGIVMPLVGTQQLRIRLCIRKRQQASSLTDDDYFPEVVPAQKELA